MKKRRDAHSVTVGQKVRILSPAYAADLCGQVLGPEEDQNGHHTGHWLIKIEAQDMIFALTLEEFELLTP